VAEPKGRSCRRWV